MHDLRLPFWIHYFQYAFGLFDALRFYTTPREFNAVFRTLSQSLQPDGLLVFEYLNADYVEAHLQEQELKMINNVRYDIHNWQDNTHFYKRITIADPQQERPLEYLEKRPKYRLREFREMLKLQKMHVQATYGDFNLQHFDGETSPCLMVIAKKDT